MNKLPLALTALVLIVLAFFLYRESTQNPVMYANETYNIAFTYPEGYVLSEKEVGDAHHGHYAITFIRTEDTVLPEGGEGPTGITIDIYQNDVDQYSLVTWLTSTNGANFKLGDGTYASTTVDGVEALRNRWSGLYEGETISFVHQGNIIAVTVTRLSPDDHTAAYEHILRSIELMP